MKKIGIIMFMCMLFSMLTYAQDSVTNYKLQQGNSVSALKTAVEADFISNWVQVGDAMAVPNSYGGHTYYQKMVKYNASSTADIDYLAAHDSIIGVKTGDTSFVFTFTTQDTTWIPFKIETSDDSRFTLPTDTIYYKDSIQEFITVTAQDGVTSKTWYIKIE